MTRKTRYELMRPSELVEARTRASVAFLPIGPIEWHGPHLPLGTDGLHAFHLAERVCAETGGAVFPPLFLGTDTFREPGTGPQQTASLGLGDREDVFGMDFPGFATRSLYTEESAFGVAVRAVVRPLLAAGWHLVVIISGHGAGNHQNTLRRIAREESATARGQRVLYYPAWAGIKGAFGEPGHADRFEADVLLALEPEHVDLSSLPPASEPIRYHETGIVDPAAFEGSPASDWIVPESADPRRSSVANGTAIVAAEVREAVAFVRSELATLGDGTVGGG